MQKKPRKKSGLARKLLLVVGVVVFLLALLQIVTSFYFGNWEKHKARIAPAVKAATGRVLQVEGGLSFRLLPSPTFILKEAVLLNDEGAIAPEFARIGRVVVKPSWGDLFSDSPSVSHASLYGAHIAYEGQVSAGPGSASASMDALMQPLMDESRQLRSVSLYDTTLDHIIGEKDNYIIRSFFSPLTAVRMEGAKRPLAIESQFNSDQTDLDFLGEFEIGDMRDGKEARLKVKITANSAYISVDGVISQQANAGIASKGTLEAKLDDSVATFGTILSNGDERLSSIIANGLAGEPIMIRSNYVAGENKIGFTDLEIAGEHSVGQGLMLVELGDLYAVKTKLHFSRIDLDMLLQKNTDLLSAIQLKHAKSAGKFGLIHTEKTFDISDLSSQLHLNAELSAEALVYREHVMHDAAIAVVFEEGGMVVRRMQAMQLPGEASLELNSALDENTQQRVGLLHIKGKQFVPFLNWLGVRAQAEEGKLQDFTITGKANLSPKKMEFQRIDVNVDDLNMVGQMVIDNSQAKVANAAFRIENLNVNQYMAPKPAAVEAKNPQQDEVILGIFKRFDAVRALDWYFDRLRLAITIDSLQLQDRVLSNAKGTLDLGDGVLRLNNIAYSDAGNNVVGHVSIDTRSLKPTLDVALAFDHLDLPRFAAFIGLDFFDKEETVPALSPQSRWDQRRLFLEPLGFIENKVKLQARRFTGYGLDVDNMLFQAEFNRKDAKIHALQFDIFDGRLSAAGNMMLSPPEVTLNISLPEFAFEKAANQLFGISNLSGRMALAGDIFFAGLSAERWAQSISGKLEFITSGIAMDGFDTALLQERIPQLEAIKTIRYWTDYSLNQGVTQTKRFDGVAHLSQGKLTFDDIAVPSRAYQKATLSGAIDISEWKYNTVFTIVCDFAGALVGITHRAVGAVTQPNTAWNTDNIERYWEKLFYGG